MNRFLKQIFKAFEMSKCWDGEEGAASGSDNSGEGETSSGDDIGGATIAVPYIGSKELNPEQRPLKMNVDGYDNQAIDDLIDVTEDPFLTDEEIVARDKVAEEKDKGESGEKEKKTDDKTDDKTVDKSDDKTDKEDDADSGEEDPDVKHFYDTTGLTVEEFKGLSETARKNISDKVFGDPATSEVDAEKITKLEAELKQSNDSLKALENDPIISARLDEHATGKNYVAKSIPGLTSAQATAIYEADSVEEATKLVNKFFTGNVAEAINIQNTHIDAKKKHKEDIKESNALINSLGEIDPRLKFDEIDWHVEDFNIYNKNKKFEEMVAMTQIIRKKGITTAAQIKALGKETIYSIIQRENGWDKSRDDTIAKNAKKDIMDKLLNPRMAKSGKKAAASLIQSGRDVNIKESINRKALVEELKNGIDGTFNKLSDQFEGDIPMIEELGRIQREGANARAEFLKNKT